MCTYTCSNILQRMYSTNIVLVFTRRDRVVVLWLKMCYNKLVYFGRPLSKFSLVYLGLKGNASIQTPTIQRSRFVNVLCVGMCVCVCVCVLKQEITTNPVTLNQDCSADMDILAKMYLGIMKVKVVVIHTYAFLICKSALCRTTTHMQN